MLTKIPGFKKYEGPILMVIMDGIGLSDIDLGNCVNNAYKPVLENLMNKYPTLRLKAHGTAVGLPSDDDMGNSEVGHNAIGAGKVYDQGAMLVNDAIKTGRMFTSKSWLDLVGSCVENGGAMHFIGLLSDGNVHSHINHLEALISQAKKDGLKRVRVHILLDGRDVGETSALEYVEPFEEFLKGVSDDGFDARIASGGGRMNITMDRYEADWTMVKRGWDTHVRGIGRQFRTAKEAILTFRSEAHVIDQDLPPFVIVSGPTELAPVGRIMDGDSVIFFNFRGDRAIEISRAFEETDFNKFDRSPMPKVLYAGMLLYDGDLQIPSRYLVSPPEIKDTLGEHLCGEGIRQLAISETQKFGHVTYFWNGNRSGKFDESLETYIEIPSDRVPFEQRPWMKAAEVTDELIKRLRAGEADFVRINFANGDMVGHTGNYAATLIAVQTVDICLSRILPVIDELGGMAIITADHGNADEMYEISKKTGRPSLDANGRIKAKTSHTLNKVPCIFYDNTNPDAYKVLIGDDYGLSNFASTIANLLGFESPDFWDKSIIEIK